jgi:HK97 family phage portal protein
MLADLITRASRDFLASTNNPDQWLIDWTRQGEPTAAGEAITEENALHCPAVKAAVSLLCESLALASIEVCERKGPQEVEVLADHELAGLFNRQPNPETNSMAWWEAMQGGVGTYGNGYAQIQRTVRGNRTVALWNRSSKRTRTKPLRSKEDGQIYYECRNANGQVEDMVPAADMLHVKYFTLDGIFAVSPVRMIRETIGGNRAAERMANELFSNGDLSQGYFTHPGRLSRDAYARLKKSLAEMSEHANRHRKGILEEGVVYKGEKPNPQELQMIEAREYLDLVIARAYGIDAQLLQMKVNGSLNLSDLGRKFVVFTLALWGERWTSEINSKLLKPPYFARWNWSVFLRNNPEALSQEHRTNFTIGKQSINEMRHERGDNRLDDPNADEHFVPLNMVPLSKAGDVADALISRHKDPMGSPVGGNPHESRPDMPSGGGDGKQPAMPGGQEGGRPQKQSGQPKAESGEISAVNGDPSPLLPQPLAAADPMEQDLQQVNRVIAGALAEQIRDGVANQLATLDVEKIVAETLSRFERLEANEALRAAKEPKTFLSRLDAFYAQHTERLGEALERPVRALVMLRSGPLSCQAAIDAEIQNTINEHLAGKRQALLNAAECQPAELAARVQAVVKDWGRTSGE